MKPARKLPLTHDWRTLSLALVLLLLVVSVIQSAHAAVTLLYFLADGQNGRVVLEWETETELDNAGFFINRSLQEESGFTRISSFIPAQGDDLTGASYVYTDTNVTNGTTYWYLLESIDFGQNSVFHMPPSSVIPGAEDSTPTATATRTTTLTPQTAAATSTATQTFAPTFTATSQPTSTSAGAYPGPATSTPVPQRATLTPIGAATSTGLAAGAASSPLQATGVISATITATFLPLPEIVMQFPQAPDSRSFDIDPALLNNSQMQIEQQDAWRSPGRILFIGFIVTIWVLLAGWFFFSIRKLE